MVWKSNADEAEPRSSRVALRLWLIWTFSRCLSQEAVVLCYVACGFRMSSGMKHNGLKLLNMSLESYCYRRREAVKERTTTMLKPDKFAMKK